MSKMIKTNPGALPEFGTALAEIIRGNDAPKEMAQRLRDFHEKDIALTLPELSAQERQRLFRLLPAQELAAVLEYAEDAPGCFAQLSLRQRSQVLSYMEGAEAAELLRQMPKQERACLLELLEPQTRGRIRLIDSFDDDQIGSRMSTNYIRITQQATVKEAMTQLVEQAAQNDNITTLYLVDEAGIFCGAIDLKELIIAREGTSLSQITMTAYPYVYAQMEIADCIPFLTEYAEASIPVLDEENRLVGVVTAQDFVELLDDALGEDYAKLAGLSQQEDLEESVTQSVKKRLPWLCILLALGMGVSAVVGLFEGIVAQIPVILCFQSLILDMAGNVGTQSLAVAIRVLMDSQLTRRQKAALVWKETRIGWVNGLILGVLSFGAIGLYLGLSGNAWPFAFGVSGCLGLAMVLAMVVSALSGTLIPLFFKTVGIDPAVASGPLITTVNDMVAVVAYYGLAWLILLRLMGVA